MESVKEKIYSGKNVGYKIFAREKLVFIFLVDVQTRPAARSPAMVYPTKRPAVTPGRANAGQDTSSRLKLRGFLGQDSTLS